MFFSGATRNGVLALRMGYHEMVEDVGDGIRKLAFSDGSSDKAPRVVEPVHSKRVLENSSTGSIFQTDTTGNSSNQILKISDSDIARGVFIVLFFQPFIVLFLI